MKINRKALSMALGGAILPLGIAAANDSIAYPKPLSSTGRISDSSPMIGTSTVASQRPVMTASKLRQPTYHNASYAAQDSRHGDMIMMDDTSYSAGGCSSGGCSSSGCDAGGCDCGGCDSSCGFGSRAGRILGCGLGNMLGWGEVEALLWWAPHTQTPPLVVQGGATQFPQTVLLGGSNEPLGGEMIPGLRANFGFWLDDCQSIGAGGRVFGLFGTESTHTFSSNGTSSLGVPYLDIFQAQQGQPLQGAQIVAQGSQGQGVNTGSITVGTDTDFIAAEAYGRLLLARTGTSRADMIGGYTFARLDDALGLSTRSVNGITDAIIDGTVTETFDQFSTSNTFHGGHIGFTTDITRGRWTFSTLGKVALGTMSQESIVGGRRTITPPTGNGPQVTQNNGILTYGSNDGTLQRDVFTFIPEAGAKLRYCLTPKVKFNVGYTFIFFPDVAMASSLIDPVVDTRQSEPFPQSRIGSDTYYLHGVDLGLSYQF
jgi:Putative beta barrel porin-7 (BBP7)